MSFPYRTYRGFRGSGPITFLAYILLPIIAFALGWQISESRVEVADRNPTALVDKDATVLKNDKIESIDVALLRDAIDVVREKFIDPDKIDPDKIKYGIVRGLIWSLEDPYSEFMSPEESISFEDELGGDIEGIGAELTVKEGMIIVISPLRDSPAERGGLLPEDVILEVNDEAAEGKDFLKVIGNIRGKKGTPVKLSIFRPSTGEKLSLEIVRDKIRIETVTLTMQDELAILEVSQFGKNTTKEFEDALASALVKNPKGIIVDLRFNSGGYLETAIEMVSAFQKSGKVVIQKGRPPATDSRFVTGKVKTDLPLVVLQNGGSASASEIVAGAIQDLGRGVVIGEKSFGKGTVQELIAMENGANLRLTVAKWLTPNGRDIGEVGIEPDLTIVRSPQDIADKKDPQLDAAIAHLKGESLQDLAARYPQVTELAPTASPAP